MARPKTKEELLKAANENFTKLWAFIDSMPKESLKIEFDFTEDKKKKEAHWKRDKNLRDILIHLYEWHQLLLNWVAANTAGDRSAFLPEPYTWKTYAELNVVFWNKHQKTNLKDSESLLKSSHQSVIELIQKFSNTELFTKQHFDWTGTTSLGSYCISTLSSHYDWAIKKLRAHTKKVSKA